MEKVLHDSFYVQKIDQTGEPIGKLPVRYDRRFAPYLIDGANNHIKQLKDRDSIQTEHDAFIHSCMDEFLKNGASRDLINTLNRNIGIIGHQCHVMPSNKKILAAFVAHIPHKPPPNVFAAYMFSNMASLGWLEGLKRCRNPECKQFFIGRSNVKWCSKSCGSLFRVRQKRKKDKY
ncbi:MAG: CGNR zinc finger domain-containing protein [Bdellovibrionia bacterium]